MKPKKKIEDKYKLLDDIDHVLLRNGMYIGSVKPHTSIKYLLNNGEMKMEEVTFIPGFLKLFDEIIMNSVDESKRDDTRLNTIKVSIEGDTISVWDNGGIEVVEHPIHKQYVPEMIFSNMKAGANFNDEEDRIGAGTNGVGSSLVNIFSTKFIVNTCDGINKFTQVFSDNMKTRKSPTIKESDKNFTEIKYTPDYPRFGLTGMDDIHFRMIEKRVYDIAGCNPNLKVFFNNKEIKIKSFEDYIKLYTKEYFFETNKDKSWSFGIASSDDGFQHISFVNSNETYDGGTHVDYIVNQIIIQLRNHFNKKYKVDLKPSEFRNHIKIFLSSTIINPIFHSQTKEKLSTEVKDYGYTHLVSDKMIKQILKSEIVESILDWVNKKKQAEENKLTRELNKSISKAKVEKLIDARSKKRHECSLGIFEGDSSVNSFRRYWDETQGAFPIRGKFKNVSEITNDKLAKNDEALKLMASLGLKLGQKATVENLRYGKILLYVDADVDGNSIAGLLINFFYKYWKELFEMNMIYKVETPIVVVSPKKKTKNSEKVSFYSQNEYDKWVLEVGSNITNYNIAYKKGLASLLDDEYEQIIKNPRLTLIKIDDESTNSLDIWFGKESDNRKYAILNEK